MLIEFEGHDIQHRDTREFGGLGNLIAAQKFLQQDYVILLHDDDLIHPEYLGIALRVLLMHPEVNLLTANTVPWDIDQVPIDLPSLSTKGHLFSSRDYATYVYNAGHPSYSLAIYKSHAFKTINILEIIDRYGKWGDVPIMLETIQSGKAVVLTDACGWMGVHLGQDSNDESTRPSYQAWIAREANFLRFMGDDPRTLAGLSFCLMNYRHMRSGYKRRVRKDVTFKRFLDEARIANALTKRGEWSRLVSFRMIQKLLEGYMAKRHRRSVRQLMANPAE